MTTSACTVSRVAWGLWAASVLLAIASVSYLWVGWSTPPPAGTFGFRGFAAIFAVSFGTVGAIVASRLPNNPIGWLMLATALLSGIQEAAFEYAIWAILVHEVPLSFGEVAAWVPAWIWVPGTSCIMFALFVFPDGHLLSRRWRWAVALGAAGTLVSTVGFAAAPGPLENFFEVDDPFGIGERSLVLTIGNIGLLLYGVGFVFAGASIVIRYRRAVGEDRQQLRWLVAASAFLVVAMVVSFVGQFALSETGGVGLGLALLVIAGFSTFPIAMGIAILRYRLYDLDIVIRKTVVFGILVVLLTALFVTIALGVGGSLARRDGGWSGVPAFAAAFVIGVSTIPLWRLSRRIADRLVFGGRATPYEVLAEFAERVSDTYSSDDVSARMAGVLGEAMGAAEATVWLWLDGRYQLEASWPPGRAATSSTPSPDLFQVHHQGQLLGALAVRQPGSDPMSPSKQRLARDLASQAGPVLRNVLLIEELRDSRRRIVAAQDARAKKLERNIHDGAQQQLVALAVKQRLVESLIGKDDDRARALLRELQAEANEALEDLRDLARGIYPPLLVDRGLVAAIGAQARKVPMTVSVESDGVDRYEAEVESAVYFCVLEALQNASKYAGASTVTVKLVAGDGAISFSVRDDGLGFDPSSAMGSGLTGIADRLAALGGELTVVSQPGEGTTIRGRLPVEGGSRA